MNNNKIQAILAAVRENAGRLGRLGNWPEWIGGEKSLTDRIPVGEDANAPGFDAGLAAALDLIPRDRQGLAAVLHAAYTEEAVEQVRREMADPSPDCGAVWWLAACSICQEGGINEAAFLGQIEAFERLAADPDARLAAAVAELGRMKKRFTSTATAEGIPFVVEDGGIQGAYLSGYDWAVQWSPAYGLFFIGTFRPSLGLETFQWYGLTDGRGLPLSGPVHGSRQFVKCATLEEVAAATKVVQRHLGWRPRCQGCGCTCNHVVRQGVFCVHCLQKLPEE